MPSRTLERPLAVAGCRRRLTSPLLAASFATLSATWLATPLAAQTEPMLTARTLVESGNGSACAVGVTSDLALRVPGASVSVVSMPLTGGLPRAMPTPLLAFDGARAFDRRWQLRAAGIVGPSESRCASPSQWTRGWVQLARSIRHGGVSIAVGARSLSSLDPSRDRSGVTFALWQQRRIGRFGVDVRTYMTRSQGLSRFTYPSLRPDSTRRIRSDSVRTDSVWERFSRPVQMPDSAVWTQQSQSIALRTHWQRRIGRTSLDLTAGAIGDLRRSNASPSLPDSSLGDASFRWSRIQPWVRADARVRVRSWADLLLGVAALPVMPEQRTQTLAASSPRRAYASRVFSIGLSVAARARDTASVTSARDSTTGTAHADAPVTREAFEVRRLDRMDSVGAVQNDSASDDGRVAFRLRLRDPGAQSVEVSGEPFGWRAVSLVRVDADWWETRVRLQPGTWRMSVRRDGRRWTAPPGFPALQDEFGGEVALITVR
jgi:hypothetical protein